MLRSYSCQYRRQIHAPYSQGRRPALQTRGYRSEGHCRLLRWPTKMTPNSQVSNPIARLTPTKGYSNTKLAQVWRMPDARRVVRLRQALVLAMDGHLGSTHCPNAVLRATFNLKASEREVPSRSHALLFYIGAMLPTPMRLKHAHHGNLLF